MPKIVAGLDLRSVTQPLWLLRYVGIRFKEGIFFFFKNTKFFNTYRERRENLKETDNNVYPK